MREFEVTIKEGAETKTRIIYALKLKDYIVHSTSVSYKSVKVNTFKSTFN